ncbi:hypothetical protein CQA53_05165 [Helicobacter didelphidarum]|uniref:Lipoprotein n=1 Tax=Helicobacter didelphidarum TaxID=2040648 RepID=A0A3D8IM48_9HELI|nr:hypothetical protein CQA53_05165 [Helicobacter didelphidarum]
MKNLYFLPFFLLFLCACSQYQEQVKREYDGQYYVQTYKTLQKATQKKSNDLLLWQMQSAFLTFSYFGPYFSFMDFERAETTFKAYESEGLLAGVGANIGVALSNDMAIPYRGYIYEGVLLNYYKALAYSSIGDDVNARIEFNRANDRQRRAKDYYAKEIKKTREKTLEEANKKKESVDYERNVSDENIDTILNQRYSNLKNFSIYQDLINPTIPYVSGLFFMIEKDFSKSEDLLKESYGITQASIIANDMKLLESRRYTRGSYPTYTWIIIEDGNIARKYGNEFSLPIFIGSGINAVNLALPNLDNGYAKFSTYKVNSQNADLITQMSKLFASEFEKQLTPIITRAIIGAIVKFAITESVNQFGGDYGQLIGLVATLAFSAITRTDTRSSIILPNSVWVARIPNTDSKIEIFGDNYPILNIEVNAECNSLANRLQGSLEFNELVKAKPKDLHGRINVFKRYNYDSKVCSSTDNIVYIRTHNGTITHFVLKGN